MLFRSVTAAASTLEGAAGFYRAFGGSRAGYGERVCVDLDREFEMAAVTYKAYPISQFLQNVVRGVLALRARAGTRSATAIKIAFHPFEADFIGMRATAPFASDKQALTSAPFCAARAWLAGDVTLAGLRDFGDPQVAALARKVEVVADASRARYTPRCEVTLDTGELLEIGRAHV